MSKWEESVITNARKLLKQRASLSQGFSDDYLRQLVNGSCLASFEANEAIAY